MKRNCLVTGCLSLLFTLMLASISFADVSSFSASVFGTAKGPINCQAPPNPCEFLLSGEQGEAVAYTGFTIAGDTSTTPPKPAKIVAIEGDTDKVLIQDAVITSTTAGQSPCTNTATGIESCPLITYSATFSSPPSTDGGDVVFVRSIAGTFKRGANPAANSAVKIRGVVAGYLVGTDGFKKIVANSSLYSAVGPAEIYDRSQIWYLNGNPALPDPRTVSGLVWVYAKNVSDVLTLTAETVKNPVGGGGDVTPDCAANKKTKGGGKLCKKQ
jgi:hypothetical protein